MKVRKDVTYNSITTLNPFYTKLSSSENFITPKNYHMDCKQVLLFQNHANI